MKKLKLFTLLLGVLIIFVCSWYLVAKITSAPLAVYSFPENGTAATLHKDVRLKVASYNIAHGRGGVYGAKNNSHESKEQLLDHLDKIVQQIKSEDPDLIVLNEVDFSSAWSFNVNQAQYIAQKGGYAYVLEQKNMDIFLPFYRFCFGNAILSKYPLGNEKIIDFPPYSQLEDIFFGNHDGVFCELQAPAGPIGIFGIHLEYRSEDIRVRCAKSLTVISSGMKYPVLLLGDFNSTPVALPRAALSANGENAMVFFAENGFVSYLPENIDKAAYTFPSAQPDRLIDWIIGKGIRSFSGAKNIPSNLSDHLMIAAEVEIVPNEDKSAVDPSKSQRQT